MIGLFSTTTRPEYNLATEEYLLKNLTEDVFFLYVNDPSIIVGKHQNTLAEINYNFVNDSKIKVHRRLSGGGTVYHDSGNLNFCFIHSGEKGKLVDFAKHTQPIINALNKLNIPAVLGKRHDILIEGKKVSGNASHVYKNRVMHHGTLLFNSKLDVLNKALKTNPRIFKDKAVRSVRSEVTNISEYLEDIMSFHDFSKYIFKHLLSHFPESVEYQLDLNAQNKIDELIKEKYSLWQWNYGYSPTYEVKKRIKTKSNIRIESRIKVEKGIIREIILKSNNNTYDVILEKIRMSTLNLQHDEYYLNNRINTFNSKEVSTKTLLELFF